MSLGAGRHAPCSGDALVLSDGKVEPFYRTWNMNHDLAVQSLNKLAALEHVSVLCTANTKCSFEFNAAMGRNFGK